MPTRTSGNESNVALSRDLLSLATALAPAVGGPAPANRTITPHLVYLASRRHFVAPLLFGAIGNADLIIGDAQRAVLERAYVVSGCNRASALTRLTAIADTFKVQNISWMALKGTTQAELLYQDPAWRASSDIDILVAPADMDRAIGALQALNYVASNPPMPESRLHRHLLLRAIKDVTFIARDDHSCAVELHQKLFAHSSARRQPVLLTASATPIPSTVTTAELAHYLILHGAISFWVRLKWLVDLVPLLAKLPQGEIARIAALAEHSRTADSTAASLLLLRSIFPFAATAPLDDWLSRRAVRRSVAKRRDHYALMLNLPSDWKRSPLDNRAMATRSSFLFYDSFWPAAVGVVTTGVPSRLLRQHAGWLRKEERALTISDTPPALTL